MKKLYAACLSLVIFCSLLVGVVTADSQTQPTIHLTLPSLFTNTTDGNIGLLSGVQPTIQGLTSDSRSPTQFILPSDAQTQPPTNTTTTTTTTTTTPTTMPMTAATLLSALPSNLQAMMNLI